MIVKLPATAKRPTPTVKVFFGISRIANVISARAPPTATKPFPIWLQSMFPKSDIGFCNISIAFAIITRLTDVFKMCLDSPAANEKAAISVKTAPTAIRPVSKISVFRLPKPSTALCKTKRAADKITIPTA